MLRRDVRKSFLFCNGFGMQYYIHMGRGVLPLLAVILLVAPPLAFANGVTVTVDPRSLDIDEPQTGTPVPPGTPVTERIYSVVLDAQPEEEVVVNVVGAENRNDLIIVTEDGDRTMTFTRETSITGETPIRDSWNVPQEVTVTAVEDDDAVDGRVTITHTATIDGDEVTLRDATVIVHVADPDEQTVTVEVLGNGMFGEADAIGGSYTVVLDSEPTGRVTLDVGGVDVGGETGEFSVSPSRLVFTRDNWDLLRRRSVSTRVRISMRTTTR